MVAFLLRILRQSTPAVKQRIELPHQGNRGCGIGGGDTIMMLPFVSGFLAVAMRVDR
jgi:hypothetical protein